MGDESSDKIGDEFVDEVGDEFGEVVTKFGKKKYILVHRIHSRLPCYVFCICLLT